MDYVGTVSPQVLRKVVKQAENGTLEDVLTIIDEQREPLLNLKYSSEMMTGSSLTALNVLNALRIKIEKYRTDKINGGKNNVGTSKKQNSYTRVVRFPDDD